MSGEGKKLTLLEIMARVRLTLEHARMYGPPKPLDMDRARETFSALIGERVVKVETFEQEHGTVCIVLRFTGDATFYYAQDEGGRIASGLQVAEVVEEDKPKPDTPTHLPDDVAPDEGSDSEPWRSDDESWRGSPDGE